MTIDELAFKCACEALSCVPAIDMSPREAHEIRRHATETIKDVIGHELAAKDAVPEDGNLPIVEEALREQETACQPHVAAIADLIGVPLTKENYAVLRGAWALSDLLGELVGKVSAKNAELRKDAERYRKIREGRGSWAMVRCDGGSRHAYREDLDSVLDGL